MRTTDFASLLSKYLLSYLPCQRGVSDNTLASYEAAFSRLFQYCEEERGLPVRKITVETLSPNLIEGYLNWLCEKQKNSASTRNQRLSAIKAFLSLPVEKIHAIFTPAKESSKFPQKSVQRQSYSTFHMRKSRKC